MNQALQSYQQDCVNNVVADGAESSSIYLAFGLGKLRMIGEFLHAHYNVGIRFVVMENMSRVRKLWTEYVKESLRSFVFTTASDTDEPEATAPADAVQFVSNGGDGVVLVTYQSFATLIQTVGDVTNVSCIFFDEPYMFKDAVTQWIGTGDVFRRRLLFSAVPYEEPFQISEEAPQSDHSEEIQVRFGLYENTDSLLSSKIQCLVRNIVSTGNGDCLRYISEPDRDNFVALCDNEIAKLVSQPFNVKKIDPSTPSVERAAFLNGLNADMKGQLIIISQDESVPEENRLFAFIHVQSTTPLVHTIMGIDNEISTSWWSMSYNNSVPLACAIKEQTLRVEPS